MKIKKFLVYISGLGALYSQDKLQSTFDLINAVLVSMNDLFQKHKNNVFFKLSSVEKRPWNSLITSVWPVCLFSCIRRKRKEIMKKEKLISRVTAFDGKAEACVFYC